MEIKKFKAWLICCKTGCSCCSYENHLRGPYKTKEDAEKRKAYFYHPDSKYWPLSSQYASRGRNKVKEITVEVLPDGRYIIDSEYVCEDFEFVEVLEDGSVKDNDSEYFKSDD